MKIINVVGARPNFMKIAPIIREMNQYPQKFNTTLVHTGQHYDAQLSRLFFEELDIPPPDINLGVGSATHAVQTAKIMEAFENVLDREQPNLVLVVGDVNSTLACTLTAVKKWIPVGHIEAGLRSRDRHMPEEINRIVTDALSDYLFTTSPDANENLVQEGIAPNRIFFVGNVMIDTLLRHRERALELPVLAHYGLEERQYALITLHRPSNVDPPQTLDRIIDALARVQRRLPILFSIHPRTAQRLEAYGFRERLEELPYLICVEPLGYLEFLNLTANARFVLTDSGGIQEETTILGIPCLTLRDSTERPVTVTEGTNLVIGNDPERIVTECEHILNGGGKQGHRPAHWDGQAAARIVRVLLDHSEQICAGLQRWNRHD